MKKSIKLCLDFLEILVDLADGEFYNSIKKLFESQIKSVGRNEAKLEWNSIFQPQKKSNCENFASFCFVCDKRRMLKYGFTLYSDH